MALEDELNCFSYFGFGSGWELLVDDEGAPYCQGRCAQSVYCWGAHKERVRLIMPDLCRVFERASRRFGGQRAVTLFVKKWKVADPYSTSMVSNIQAASFYKAGHPLPDNLAKSCFRPPYPFTEGCRHV